MTPALEVNDLRVEFPGSGGRLTPVRGISFTVAKGEVLGVVGESGCGKSLTSLAVMGLLPRRAQRRVGAIRLRGEEISTLSDRAMSNLRGNRMAMIFQEPMTALNPLLTIGEQLCEIYLRHEMGSRREARARAVELLGKVGMTGAEQRMAQYPHELSGGLRQRVMIAMALMCDPDVLIADEPTTALDVTIQAQVLGVLKRLQAEFGLAVVFITHDLGVVAHIADQVMVMYCGEVVESGAVRDIFARPTHPYTRGLLACLPGGGQGGALGSIPGTVPTATDRLEGCAFANRCPHVEDACRTGTIDLRAAAAGHSYRCILPTDRLRTESLP